MRAMLRMIWPPAVPAVSVAQLVYAYFTVISTCTAPPDPGTVMLVLSQTVGVGAKDDIKRWVDLAGGSTHV